jgi:hypothetical protein
VLRGSKRKFLRDPDKARHVQPVDEYTYPSCYAHPLGRAVRRLPGAVCGAGLRRGSGAGQQCILMLLSVLSAVAVAGIPGGSMPLIAGLLATFGVPPEGIGIVLGVARILGMLRTTVNVGSDIVTATVVDARVKAASTAS